MTPVRRRALLLLLLAALLAVAGCAVPAQDRGAAFAGATVDGGSFDSATLAGTPAVLWFWAPWCTVCRAEAPDVAAVAAEYEGRVRFVGVPGLGPVDDMKRFVADTGTAGFTHVVDADGALWQRFGVVAQPAFAFVAADGTVTAHPGGLDGAGLRAAARDLLGP